VQHFSLLSSFPSPFSPSPSLSLSLCVTQREPISLATKWSVNLKNCKPLRFTAIHNNIRQLLPLPRRCMQQTMQHKYVRQAKPLKFSINFCAQQKINIYKRGKNCSEIYKLENFLHIAQIFINFITCKKINISSYKNIKLIKINLIQIGKCSLKILM